MQFRVCPHDMVKSMQSWLALTTYLRQALEVPVTLAPVTDFEAFYRQALPQAELAFVNPLDAWRLVHEQGFIPVARTELYDEVVFITAPDAPEAALEDLAGQPLAAVDKQFATYLGLYILHTKGIGPVHPVWKPSWVQVIRAVMTHQAPFGLLYHDFYTQLSPLTRAQFRVVFESHTRYATHMMLLHPAREDLRPRLQQVLVGMSHDPQGAALLQELRLGRWVPTDDLGDIDRIIGQVRDLVPG